MTMSTTRVLHLITRYVGGGAETTTRNTLEALAADDRDYDLRLGTGAEHDPERLRALPDVATVVFRTLRHYNPLTAPVAVLAVGWYLRRERIDVLHTHSTEAGIVGRLAAALAGTPVVIHEVHGDPVAVDRHPLLNRFVLLAERTAAPLADCLVVVADRLGEIYLDRDIGRPGQYRRIYDGVDLARFDGAVDAVADRPGGPVRLVFVGRLADGKGMFDLLDAVERLASSGRDVRLDVVGDGPLTDAVARDVASRDLPVSLLGYRDDVPVVLARADVLVLPSYREGTPRVITEAMAAGLPVVSTAIAGIPEQVLDGETGYLVEPGDVDALTGRLRELVDEPDRRRAFGEQARDRAERFDVEAAQRQYRELYRELCDEADQR